LEALLQKLKQAVEEGQPPQAPANNPNEIVEDLGTMTVNGVPARGTRITTVVPLGAIGNDREFRSVNERWFSSDLNLLIKSINTDPRFGTTTYELTNISRQPPDPCSRRQLIFEGWPSTAVLIGRHARRRESGPSVGAG
jgi:hypothetical protein